MPTTQQIAHALGCPAENVAANWPTIQAALTDVGLVTTPVLIAALATIRVECPPFKPRAEEYNGDPHAYFARYDGRKDLGNEYAGDGYKFRGRGYIQITGRYNYARFGARVGANLLNNPDLALEPITAAAIFAAFFYARPTIGPAATYGDWQAVRKAINGGLNGYADFLHYVTALSQIYQVTPHVLPEIG